MNKKFNYLKDPLNILLLALLLIFTIYVLQGNYLQGQTKTLLTIGLSIFYLYFLFSPLLIKPKPTKRKLLDGLVLIIIGIGIITTSIGALYKFLGIAIATIISSILNLSLANKLSKPIKKQQDITRQQLQARVVLTAFPALIDIKYNITSMFLSTYYTWIAIISIIIILTITEPLWITAFKKHK